MKLEAQISPLPPVVLGGVLVVPMGLLAAMASTQTVPAALMAARQVDTQAAAAHARAIVMAVERSLGFEPTDREFEQLGYESRAACPGRASCGSSR